MSCSRADIISCMYLNGYVCKMKFREPYKFEKIMEGEEDVGEDAPAEEKEEIEHELDESLPIINFASCTSDEFIDFFDLMMRRNYYTFV